VYYHELWKESKSPLEALRRAQLALYRNPDAVSQLIERGPEFFQTVKRVTQPPAKGAKGKRSAPVKDWAAFVLSGAGR
jgi:CHAT domain-containing protein